MHDVLERRRVLRQLEERLVRERVEPEGRWIRQRLLELDGDGRKNSARHGQEVWSEYQVGIRPPRRERRAHFIEVAMSIADPVRPKVAGDLTEQQLALGRI